MEAKRRVLIVDDDPDFVDLTSAVLTRERYQVSIAHDGAEGIRKMREEHPDLILLDILMPEKDGFTVADEMSRDPSISKIPVLALTSFSENIGQPFPFKVTEYLQKGTSPKDLVAKIEKHLGTKAGYPRFPTA